jgi:pyrroline-5-carboxylate reductase
MGRALAGGLLRSGKVSASALRATARTKATSERLSADLGISCSIDNARACEGAEIVVLCVKPRDIPKVLEGLAAKKSLGKGALLISIAAGVSTTTIETLAGPSSVPVVRAMPNTPCFIGKGMTVVSKGAGATDDHVALAREIFSTMGRTLELEEKHMDTVTGLSASGPAFIYLIIEALADGGVMRGLPRNVANELAAQMTLGAAEMVLTTGRHPAALKDDVTTPAGCTIAGILALEDGRIRSVLARAVETAARVAGELGK